MAQVLTARPVLNKFEDAGKESYEIDWIIPDWEVVRKLESLVSCQEAVFETGSSPSAWFRTKWLVGLKLVPAQHSGMMARSYLKLLDIKGPPASNKLQAKLTTQLLNVNRIGDPYLNFVTDKTTQEVKLFGTLESSRDNLHFNPKGYHLDYDSDFIAADGEIKFLFRLVLDTIIMSDLEREQYEMEHFSKVSAEQLRRNHAALLNENPENADLKIISSDEVEIPAHRLILKAQCPVFAAMLSCDLAENSSGVIRMTDLSGKTVKILLHYFYTGELLPSWRDPDTVMEFTYAAGKYQMTEVLKLLDGLLGTNCGRDVSNLDVQLINLAGKLKLEKAAGRLLKRIVSKVKMATSCLQIFELFGYEPEETVELAEGLAAEQVGESEILKLIDYLFGGKVRNRFMFEKGIPLLALVEKEQLKTAEKILLKRFAEMAERMQSARSLFMLFGRGKQMGK